MSWRWTFVLVALVACRKSGAGASCEDAVAAGVGSGFASVSAPLTWSSDGDGWLAADVAFDVPEDVVGLSITAVAGSVPTVLEQVTLDGRYVIDAQKAFGTSAGRGGRRRVPGDLALDSAGLDTWDTASGVAIGGAPFFHASAPAATVVMPMNDDTRPWGGCLVTRVRALEEPPSDAELVVVTKRSAVTSRRLDLDIVVAEGVPISDAELAEVVAVVRALYDGGDAFLLGEVERWSVPVGTDGRVADRGDALDALRATVLPGSSPWSARVFIVQDFLGSSGTLGFAAGIPGPLGVPDTAGSGVMLSYDTHLDDEGALDTRLLGETMAHEVGHQLGLFHTTEESGDSFDVMTDTPECDLATFDENGDGAVDALECQDVDGRNFMFWVADEFAQDQLSAEQARMLTRSPAAVREAE